LSHFESSRVYTDEDLNPPLKGGVLIHLSVTLPLKTEPPKAVYNLQGFKLFNNDLKNVRQYVYKTVI
jgi:hypothetical protein